MGAALQGGGGRRGGKRRSYGSMNDINVTPMVDVMLVLLIVFMVAAPMMTVGVPVDLPKTEAASLNDKVEPLTVSVTADNRIFLQETEIPAADLVAKLRAVTAAKPDQTIFVRGDRNINYGRVMEVMGMIAAAGFPKVSLIAEQPQGPSTGAAAPAPRVPGPAPQRVR